MYANVIDKLDWLHALILGQPPSHTGGLQQKPSRPPPPENVVILLKPSDLQVSKIGDMASTLSPVWGPVLSLTTMRRIYKALGSVCRLP